MTRVGLGGKLVVQLRDLVIKMVHNSPVAVVLAVRRRLLLLERRLMSTDRLVEINGSQRESLRRIELLNPLLTHVLVLLK